MVPQLTMDGVRFRVDRRGVTTASGQAERLTYRRDTTDVAAADLSIEFATPGGPVRVTAPEGSGRLDVRRFRVTGGIRATRGDDHAVTPSASAGPGPDGRTEIRGDEPVRIDGPGYRLTGNGFDIDPAAGELAIRGNPRLVTGLPARP